MDNPDSLWSTTLDWFLGFTGATFWLWAQHLDLLLNILLAMSGVTLLVLRLVAQIRKGLKS